MALGWAPNINSRNPSRAFCSGLSTGTDWERMKDHYEFGKRLKSLLKALGMNQTELAQKTGLTQAAVSQLLAGIRDPSLHTIVKILKVIPIKFEHLVKLD